MPLSVVTCGTKDLAGDVAARYGASLICKAIRENGKANVILATGASQFEMLRTLVTCSEVDWVRPPLFVFRSLNAPCPRVPPVLPRGFLSVIDSRSVSPKTLSRVSRSALSDVGTSVSRQHWSNSSLLLKILAQLLAQPLHWPKPPQCPFDASTHTRCADQSDLHSSGRVRWNWNRPPRLISKVSP